MWQSSLAIWLVAGRMTEAVSGRPKPCTIIYYYYLDPLEANALFTRQSPPCPTRADPRVSQTIFQGLGCTQLDEDESCAGYAFKLTEGGGYVHDNLIIID